MKHQHLLSVRHSHCHILYHAAASGSGLLSALAPVANVRVWLTRILATNVKAAGRASTCGSTTEHLKSEQHCMLQASAAKQEGNDLENVLHSMACIMNGERIATSSHLGVCELVKLVALERQTTLALAEGLPDLICALHAIPLCHSQKHMCSSQFVPNMMLHFVYHVYDLLHISATVLFAVYFKDQASAV